MQPSKVNILEQFTYKAKYNAASACSVTARIDCNYTTGNICLSFVLNFIYSQLCADAKNDTTIETWPRLVSLRGPTFAHGSVTVMGLSPQSLRFSRTGDIDVTRTQLFTNLTWPTLPAMFDSLQLNSIGCLEASLEYQMCCYL